MYDLVFTGQYWGLATDNVERAFAEYSPRRTQTPGSIKISFFDERYTGKLVENHHAYADERWFTGLVRRPTWQQFREKPVLGTTAAITMGLLPLPGERVTYAYSLYFTFLGSTFAFFERKHVTYALNIKFRCNPCADLSDFGDVSTLTQAWISESPETANVFLYCCDGRNTVGMFVRDVEEGEDIIIYGRFREQMPYSYSTKTPVLGETQPFSTVDPIPKPHGFAERKAIAQRAAQIAGGDAVLASSLLFEKRRPEDPGRLAVWKEIHRYSLSIS